MIVAGLVLVVLPGPGLLALALGIVLLGRHDPTLRRSAILLRLSVRRMSRAERRWIRWAGAWLRHHQSRSRLIIREQVRRCAAGHPLSPSVWLWIVLSLGVAMMSIGVSLYMLLS